MSVNADLATALRRTIDSADLVKLLTGTAGVTQETVATATGGSVRSIRNWQDGSLPRQKFDDRLRDLAEVCAVLSDTLTPRGIGQWLRAKNRSLDGGRPAELIGADRGDDVLAAATAFVEGAYV